MKGLNKTTVKEATLVSAILRGEKSITVNGINFDLPAGQGAGTETQKLVYARIKANELLKG